MKLREKENMPVLGIFLGITALVAALLLALVSQLTAEPIRNAREENRAKAFHRLRLPEFDLIGEEVNVGGVVFYPVKKAGRNVGFIGIGTSSGYGGAIELLVGFTADGKITAVQILRHKETPGLGANVCDRKFQRTIYNLFAEAPEVPENRYLDQYGSRNAYDGGNWKIIKDGGDVAYLTGATVTSKAITAGVNEICAAYNAGKFGGKSEKTK